LIAPLRSTFTLGEINLQLAGKRLISRRELTGCADGEEHLHRVEEEKHDEQRDGRPQGKTQRLHGVQRLHVCGSNGFAP
jgi:hypothetical protein